MDLPTVVAICSLIVAIVALLHTFGVFKKIYDYFQKRKVRDEIKITFFPLSGIDWQQGFGTLTVVVTLVNGTPHKTFKNVEGKFWVDEKIFASSTNIPPARFSPKIPFLYFNFSVEILHKKTASTLTNLLLRIPQKDASYTLGADLIAEELKDWKHFGYSLKIEGDKFKIEK